MDTMLIPISEAKGRLSELIRQAQDEDVQLLRDGRPAAVIVSIDRWEQLHEELEDLEDRLAYAQHKLDPHTVPWEQAKSAT